MVTVPHNGLPLAFPPTHYRVLLRWWLGIPLHAGDSGRPCPLCAAPMDTFGDHLVSCKHNKLTQRHHGVRDALAQVLQSFGVTCRTEVSLPHREDRPGDVGLPDFDPRGPLLVDLCAIHPLAPSRTLDPATILACLSAKENSKREKYADLCTQDGYFFSPLAFHLWGGLGPCGASLLKRIIRQVVGDAQGWTRIFRSALVRNRISTALMRGVAEQLLPGLSVAPSFLLPAGFLQPPPPPPLPTRPATPRPIFLCCWSTSPYSGS